MGAVDIKQYDIVIVGGGASGMTAAVSAARANSGLSVAIIERLDRVGKKLLSTGNGRCNITNSHIAQNRYHGLDTDSAMKIIQRFDARKTEEFFRSVGVIFTTEPSCKVYPYSFQASSVLDALRFECERLSVDIITSAQVDSLRFCGDGFTLSLPKDTVKARAVIVAAGGKCAAKLGGTDSGYLLLERFGHTVTELLPSIVPIRTETALIRALKGIKINANVTVSDGKSSRAESGEVLFTDYGLSGPPILQLSRFVSERPAGKVDITLDMMPEYTAEEIRSMISFRKDKVYADKLENLFIGMLNKRVGQAVVRASGLQLSSSAVGISERDTALLAKTIKGFRLRTKGVCGFGEAQVTAGGIKLSEFDELLQSKKQPGLFACGEVLDVDGDCGGFNLQWAWSSGYIAGASAAKSVNIK